METSSSLSVAAGDSLGFASVWVSAAWVSGRGCRVGGEGEGKVACSVTVTGIVGKAAAGVDSDSVVLPPERVVRGDGYNN